METVSSTFVVVVSFVSGSVSPLLFGEFAVSPLRSEALLLSDKVSLPVSVFEPSPSLLLLSLPVFTASALVSVFADLTEAGVSDAVATDSTPLPAVAADFADAFVPETAFVPLLLPDCAAVFGMYGFSGFGASSTAVGVAFAASAVMPASFDVSSSFF